jgi:hypothetical protein
MKTSNLEFIQERIAGTQAPSAGKDRLPAIAYAGFPLIAGEDFRKNAFWSAPL